MLTSLYKVLFNNTPEEIPNETSKTKDAASAKAGPCSKAGEVASAILNPREQVGGEENSILPRNRSHENDGNSSFKANILTKYQLLISQLSSNLADKIMAQHGQIDRSPIGSEYCLIFSGPDDWKYIKKILEPISSKDISTDPKKQAKCREKKDWAAKWIGKIGERNLEELGQQHLVLAEDCLKLAEQMTKRREESSLIRNRYSNVSEQYQIMTTRLNEYWTEFMREEFYPHEILSRQINGTVSPLSYLYQFKEKNSINERKLKDREIKQKSTSTPLVLEVVHVKEEIESEPYTIDPEPVKGPSLAEDPSIQVRLTKGIKIAGYYSNTNSPITNEVRAKHVSPLLKVITEAVISQANQLIKEKKELQLKRLSNLGNNWFRGTGQESPTNRLDGSTQTGFLINF